MRTVFVFCSLVVAIDLVVAGGNDDQTSEIAKLIEELGHKESHVQDAAEKRLTQIGWSAASALEMAMASDNPELGFRAQAIHGRVADAMSEEWEAIRQEARNAFDEGRYEDVATLYGRLAIQTPFVDDLLWQGHAFQLANNWTTATDAYRRALERIEFLYAHPEVPARPSCREWPMHTGRIKRGVEGRLVGPRAVRRRSERQTRALRRQGDQLRLLIGLIERDEIGDLRKAALTFTKSSEHADVLNRTVPQLLTEYEDHLRRRLAGDNTQSEQWIGDRLTYPLWCIKELAVTQERMGFAAEALETWDKVRLIGFRYQSYHVKCDIHAMGRLLQKLSADKPLPNIPSLLLMSPEKKSYSLDYSDPRLLARAFATPYTQSAHYWDFTCSAPPGQELSSLEVSCDIEQHDLGNSGQFSCWVKPIEGGKGHINLGGIRWPKGKPPGRDVITNRFDPPPGAELVYIRSGSWKDKFTVHGITIKPTFRPRAKDGTAPTGGVSIQNQALPKGGALTYDGQKVRNESNTDFPAGFHTFAYEIPGHKDRKQLGATLVPGGCYGLFINLDSPFTTTLTNLRHFSEYVARSSIVRLTDGRWLVAYVSTEGRGYGAPLKIMLSTSKDLVTWEKPWPLFHNSIFNNKSPSLIVDERGTIWLAWFSNRLHLGRLSSEGYRLWLTHSRDGNVWSRPMPVDSGSDGPEAGIQMARDPKGRYWMFIGSHAASADSAGGIRRLSPITVDGRDISRIKHSHVAWDSENRMHMAYTTDSEKAIWFASSTDGRQWTNPIVIVPNKEGRSVENPQLFLDGEQLGVIYKEYKGAWLWRGIFHADGKSLRETSAPVKIAHHVIPLGGARLTLTMDGRVVVLAGTDTVWLLHGTLDEVFRGRHATIDHSEEK
jgi:hypothetical protein